MAPARPSNALALAVLTLLAEEPMHPYQMSATLKERHKEESIKLNYGSLYSVVDSLTKRGLVEVRETMREGNRPERTVYGITAAGSELMVTWLSDLLSTPAKEYPSFEAALSLMLSLPPDRVLNLLEERHERLRTERDATVQMLRVTADAGMPRVFGIEHEYELALLETELSFVGELIVDFTTEKLDGLPLWRRYDELRAAGRLGSQIEGALSEEFPHAFSWPEELKRHETSEGAND